MALFPKRPQRYHPGPELVPHKACANADGTRLHGTHRRLRAYRIACAIADALCKFARGIGHPFQSRR